MPGFIERFAATKVNREQLDQFQKWAFDYYHSSPDVIDPNFSATVQLDVTKARANYERDYQKATGASFTAFLFWNLIQSLKMIPALQYRRMENEWFELTDPPFCLPIYVGGEERFREVYLEHTLAMPWPEFSNYYRSSIDEAKQASGKSAGSREPELFYLATLMGYMPNLSFTSIGFQRVAVNTGRQLFYFGKRQLQGEQLLTPLAMSLDHSNADGQVVDQLLGIFAKKLTS